MVLEDCKASSWSTISQCTPQSSILGPLLFNAHINDLPLLLGNCSGMLYPDDTIINHSCAHVNELQGGTYLSLSPSLND